MTYFSPVKGETYLLCRLEMPEDLNYFLSLCLPKNTPGLLCSAVASSEDVLEQLREAELRLRGVQSVVTFRKGNPESGEGGGEKKREKFCLQKINRGEGLPSHKSQLEKMHLSFPKFPLCPSGPSA